MGHLGQFDVGLCSLFHAIALIVNETFPWKEAASADGLHFLCRWLVKYMHILTQTSATCLLLC